MCSVTKEDFCLQQLSPTANSALKSIREEMAFADETCWEPTHSKQQLQFCQLRKLKIFTMLLSKSVASIQLPTLSKDSLWHSNTDLPLRLKSTAQKHIWMRCRDAYGEVRNHQEKNSQPHSYFIALWSQDSKKLRAQLTRSCEEADKWLFQMTEYLWLAHFQSQVKISFHQNLLRGSC